MYLIEPPIPTSVGIVGLQQRFPVHRVYCVGRNYAEHSREMGGNPDREQPFFFSKPADAVTQSGRVPYPPRTANLHHEVELVVAIDRRATSLDPVKAMKCVYGYAVGVDLTRRDLQAEAKKHGRPWDVAKGFDYSAPVSDIMPMDKASRPSGGTIELAVNGDVRQCGRLEDMIWSVGEVIAELSGYYELKPGDLVFTGTPAGVGPVQPGDRVSARIAGVGCLEFELEERND